MYILLEQEKVHTRSKTPNSNLLQCPSNRGIMAGARYTSHECVLSLEILRNQNPVDRVQTSPNRCQCHSDNMEQKVLENIETMVPMCGQLHIFSLISKPRSPI